MYLNERKSSGETRYRFEDGRVLFQDGDVDNNADENCLQLLELEYGAIIAC